MGFSLFRSRRKAQAVSAEKTDENKADKTVHRSTPAENAGLGRQPLSRPGKMTRADEQKIYHANPSFIDYLPWVEFLDEEQCLLLDDGVSVGAVYAVEPAPTEGRSAGRLLEIRDAVEDALQDSLDEHDDNPWVVQFFVRMRTT